MAIYLLFIQHIIFSLSDKGKAAIVVPTGFLTGQDKITKGIREKLINEKIFSGAISMPSNIFATTGTNVSVIFIDKSKINNESVFVDASNFGTTIKVDKNQKTLLSEAEEDFIVNAFIADTFDEKSSVKVTAADIKSKNYSFNPGQYIAVESTRIEISQMEFSQKMKRLSGELDELTKSASTLNAKIQEQFRKIELTK